MRTVGSGGTSSPTVARPSGGTVTTTVISGEPSHVEHRGALRWRARLLPDDVAEALGADALDRQIRNRAFQEAGPVERLADVLVVVPAVEDADRHELPVRTRTLGCEALTVPIVGAQRAQCCEPERGHRAEFVEYFVAGQRAVALDPGLVRLADVVLHVRARH